MYTFLCHFLPTGISRPQNIIWISTQQTFQSIFQFHIHSPKTPNHKFDFCNFPYEPSFIQHIFSILFFQFDTNSISWFPTSQFQFFRPRHFIQFSKSNQSYSKCFSIEHQNVKQLIVNKISFSKTFLCGAVLTNAKYSRVWKIVQQGLT